MIVLPWRFVSVQRGLSVPDCFVFSRHQRDQCQETTGFFFLPTERDADELFSPPSTCSSASTLGGIALPPSHVTSEVSGKVSMCLTLLLWECSSNYFLFLLAFDKESGVYRLETWSMDTAEANRGVKYSRCCDQLVSDQSVLRSSCSSNCRKPCYVR